MPQPGDNSNNQTPPADAGDNKPADNNTPPPADDKGGAGDAGDQKPNTTPTKGDDLNDIDLSEFDEIEADEKKAAEDQKDTSAEGGEKKTTPSEPKDGEDDDKGGDGSGAGDGSDDKGGEGDQKPKEREEDKPKDGDQKPDDKKPDTAELDQIVDDVNAVDLYDVKPDERYNIAPITDPPDPKEGQTFQEYFKTELLPRVIQAITNKSGLVQRNLDVMKKQDFQKQEEQAGNWVKEINELKDAKTIPAYGVKQDGTLDFDSEGGKVVKAVFEYMADYNKQNPDAKVTSFKLAHKLWAADSKAQEDHKKAEEDNKNSSESRRDKARRIAGAGKTTNRNSEGRAAPGIFKGMRLDDISIDD